jgi:TolB-like protein/Tfp pilus assembly protein PilF
MAEDGDDEKASGTAAAVFVSYASQDAAVANSIVDALEHHGVRCWIAPRDVSPGEFYADAIVRALNEARALVLVLTDDGVASPHVLREVERTSSKRHAIVTLRLTNSSLPPALEYFLSASHWLDAGASGVDTYMPKLVEAVRRLVSRPAATDATQEAAELFPLPPDTKQSQRLNRLVIALGAAIALVVGYPAVDKLWLTRYAVPDGSLAEMPAIVDKSVAVLPFADMSEKKDQEYLSDGLAEELMNMLSTVPGLRVPARTSSFAFRGKETTLREIAKTLRVSHVLEGSLRKSGDRLRIVVQLIDARTDARVWSQTYDRALTDVFAVQDEIAASVVANLKISLLDMPPKARKTDPKVHDLYLQAEHLHRQSGPGDREKSIALLTEAVAIDPSYSLAWQALALDYIDAANNGDRPVEESYRLAREAAAKAIASDPHSAKAYARLAEIEMYHDGDLPSAAQHIEHALELDPLSIAATLDGAFLAQSLGRMDLAIALARSVVARDPLAPIHYLDLGSFYFFAGRPDDAIASYRTALKLNPNLGGAGHNLGLALLIKGDGAAALRESERDPSEVHRLIGLSLAFHALKQPAKSDAALAELTQKYAMDWAYNIATVLAFRGDADRAFEWLDKAVASRDIGLADVGQDPLCAKIHADPRWLPFLRKLGRSPEQLATISFDVKPPPE